MGAVILVLVEQFGSYFLSSLSKVIKMFYSTVQSAAPYFIAFGVLFYFVPIFHSK